MFQKRSEVIINPPTKVNLDSATLEPCSLLKENIVISTFDDVVNLYSDVVAAYSVCANKQNTSIKLLKQFGGIK